MMAARLATSPRTLGDLLGPAARELASLPVGDLVLDSRDVRPGAAFVAVRGARAHGLAYAAEAAANGAAVVLYEPPAGPDAEPPAGPDAEPPARSPAQPSARPGTERPAGRRADAAPPGDLRLCVPSLPIPSLAVPGLGRRLGELARRFYWTDAAQPLLAGITGTNGKSTVAYLVAQAETRRGETCGYIGTLGHGVPPVLTPHALTTPDCFTLHRELAEIAAGRVALEVSSHALAQQRIAGVELGTAAFTNLSRDHLDAHGDIERYGLAKARLFERPELRRAVLNVGDPFAARLLARLPAGVEPIRIRVRGRGQACSPAATGEAGATAARAAASAGIAGPGAGARRVEADLEAEVGERGLAGLVLEIFGRFGRARLESPLVGDFNAENLLVALGVLLAWGAQLDDACAALARASAPPGRLEVLGGRSLPTVVVDYAHTPDGLARALRVLRRLTRGELWCVFGCGGERDPGKRPLMGAAAAAGADRIVLTDDNPRGEDPRAIVAAVRAGVDAAGKAPSRVAVEHERRRAIAAAIRAARPGDVVLVAGKGHETAQLVGGERRPFSDREAALAALAALGGPP